MNRKHKREKTKKWKVEREGGRAPTASDAAAVVFEVYQTYSGRMDVSVVRQTCLLEGAGMKNT
jgi:hypothetical protein